MSQVENFGTYVFRESGIDTLHVPVALANIPEGMFYNCDSLRSIALDENSKRSGNGDVASGESVDHVTLNSSEQIVLKRTSTFPRVRKISFGDAVTSIPANLLKDKTQLEEVTFGASLTTIGTSAFYNTGVKQIELTDKITEIGASAFYNCKQLKSIKLGNGLKALPDEVFKNCTVLDSIKLPATIQSIGSRVFENCDSLQRIVLADGLTTIGDYAFYNAGKKKLQRIDIPDKVVSIGSYAFAGCDTLSQIRFGASVETIFMGALELLTA